MSKNVSDIALTSPASACSDGICCLYAIFIRTSSLGREENIVVKAVWRVRFSKAHDNAIEIKTNDEDDERQWKSISAQTVGRFVATIQPRLGVILKIIQLWVTAWRLTATHR